MRQSALRWSSERLKAVFVDIPLLLSNAVVLAGVWSGLQNVVGNGVRSGGDKMKNVEFLGMGTLVSETAGTAEVVQLSVRQILPNRYQPRLEFDDAKLDELAQTIRTHGVIQPIVVRKVGDAYELVAGERRWRAAQRVGMDYIPAIVRALSEAQAASVALIENLQREGLTAIEEAVAYQQLIELHHLTQESLAQRLGKGQSTIANKLRLLHLHEAVQSAIRRRTITERHARALLPLPTAVQERVLQEVHSKDWNVRQTEERVAALLAQPAVASSGRVGRAVLSRDARLAVNTIKQSLFLIEKSGFQVSSQMVESTDYIEFTIRVPRRKAP